MNEARQALLDGGVLSLLRDAQRATLICVIKSFEHKGLRLFFETGKTTGIQSKHAK